MIVLSAVNAATAAADAPLRVRVLSYSIHRAVGTDGETDLKRAG